MAWTAPAAWHRVAGSERRWWRQGRGAVRHGGQHRRPRSRKACCPGSWGGCGGPGHRPPKAAARRGDRVRRIAAWARSLGTIAAFGVEGTGSYGAGLARALREDGHRVIEVNRPDRSARRRNGKDDMLDAEAAARAVLAGRAAAEPKSGSSSVEMIRHLRIARDAAVKARTQAMLTIKSIIVGAPADLRERLEGISGRVTLIRHLAALRPGPITSTTASAKAALRATARRWLALHQEIAEHDRELDALVSATAPQLTAAPGVAYVTARGRDQRGTPPPRADRQFRLAAARHPGLCAHGADPAHLLSFANAPERFAYGLFLTRADTNARLRRYGAALEALQQGADLLAANSPLQLTSADKAGVRLALAGDIYTETRIRLPLLLRLDSMLAAGGAIYDHATISVELMLPQTVQVGGQWAADFPDPAQREAWVHKLANLLLLTRRENAQASNAAFAVRKAKYSSPKGGTSKFALTNQVLAEPVWTLDVLQRRQDALISKVAQAWNL